MGLGECTSGGDERCMGGGRGGSFWWDMAMLDDEMGFGDGDGG